MRWTRTGLWLLSPLASLFTAAGDDAVVSVSVGETLTEPEPKAVTEQKVGVILLGIFRRSLGRKQTGATNTDTNESSLSAVHWRSRSLNLDRMT